MEVGVTVMVVHELLVSIETGVEPAAGKKPDNPGAVVTTEAKMSPHGPESQWIEPEVMDPDDITIASPEADALPG